jgi:hypothetical protein
MTNKNFVGTIECMDGLKILAVLKVTNDGDVVSAIPFEISDTLQGKRIQFHLPIKANKFKVLSVEGDSVDDLMDLIEI